MGIPLRGMVSLHYSKPRRLVGLTMRSFLLPPQNNMAGYSIPAQRESQTGVVSSRIGSPLTPSNPRFPAQRESHCLSPSSSSKTCFTLSLHDVLSKTNPFSVTSSFHLGFMLSINSIFS